MVYDEVNYLEETSYLLFLERDFLFSPSAGPFSCP